MDLILPCLYAFISCVGFCLVFNIRGKLLLISSIGGTIGWLVFLLFNGMNNEIFQSFIAMVVVTFYSEIMARVNKVPTTIFLIIALIPLVPGSKIYYTMEYCVKGDTIAFIQSALNTIGIAGALALGILTVLSLVRLYRIAQIRIENRKLKTNS